MADEQYQLQSPIRLAPTLNPTVPASVDQEALNAFIASKGMPQNVPVATDPTEAAKSLEGMKPVSLRLTPQEPQAQVAQMPETAPTQEPAQAKPGELAIDAKKDAAAKPDLGSEILSNLKEGFSQQASGLAKAAKIGAESAAQEAGYLKQMSQAQKDMAENAMIAEMDRQSVLKKAEQELDGMKIEPNKWWAKSTTEQKIGMSLGMMLGGVGAALTGGKNIVIDQVQKMIEADTEAQKAEIGKKQNLYAMMYKRFGDERVAEAAANSYKLQGIQTKLQQVAAQYKGQQAGANAEMALGQLNERMAVEKAKFKEAIATSGSMQAQDALLKKVLELPKEYRDNGLKELAAYKDVQANLNQVKEIYADMARLQTVGQRLGSPVQSSALMDTQKARIFPVIKAIMGEAIQEADVKRMIDPYLINVRDDEKTRMEKQQNLMKVLQSKIPGRAPILSGLGVLPKMIEEGKAN